MARAILTTTGTRRRVRSKPLAIGRRKKMNIRRKKNDRAA